MSNKSPQKKKFDPGLMVRKLGVSAFVLFTFVAYAIHERFASPDDLSATLPLASDTAQNRLTLASPRVSPTTVPTAAAVAANTVTNWPVVPSATSITATSVPFLPSATPVIPTATAIIPTATTDTTPRVTAVQDANVRNGDGTTFDIINGLLAGQSATILGVSSVNPGWYLIQMADGSQGWISSSVVTTSGNVNSVQQVQPPAQPTAVPPTAASNGLYKDGQYTGPETDAYYGSVQVEVTIQNGQISDVQFLDYPHDRRQSQRINSIAMPYLTQEAVQAQSANVNIISGATLTSEAFAQSLQSALDQAKGTSA